MQKRIITGIIGIIFLLLVIYYLPLYYFYSLLFIVILISHFEFYKLFNEKLNIFFYYSVILSIFFILLFPDITEIVLFTLIFAFSLFILSVRKNFSNLKSLIIFFIANFYITLTLCYSIPIFNDGKGKHLIMLILLIAWSTDSFAYFTGTKFGKNKLCPRISPKKTVEGAVGGILGAIITGTIFNLTILHLSIIKMFLIIFITSISCILGDLYESALKRYNNKKDSGNIFPGHGGMLDRIDSLFFAIPVFYILDKLL